MSSAANQLLDLLAPRFAQMTVANGYAQSFVKITRAGLSTFDLQQDLPALNYHPSGRALVSNQHGTELWDLRITLEAYSRTSEEDNIFTDVASVLGDDVEAAIQRHPDSPTLSDEADPFLYAVGSEVVGEIQIDECVYAINSGQKPYCGAILTGRIRYSILKGSPADLLEL